MAILVEPQAIRVLYYTTKSCGHDWAEKLLDHRSATPIARLHKDGPNSGVFANLEAYAKHNGLKKIGADDILRYFADAHIRDANSSVHFDPKIASQANRYIGKLLANCVLWPLDDNLVFTIKGQKISIHGAEDLGGSGTPFLHRRAIFRVPVEPRILTGLRTQQEANKLFLAALERVGGKLELPILPET